LTTTVNAGPPDATSPPCFNPLLERLGFRHPTLVYCAPNHRSLSNQSDYGELFKWNNGYTSKGIYGVIRHTDGKKKIWVQWYSVDAKQLLYVHTSSEVLPFGTGKLTSNANHIDPDIERRFPAIEYAVGCETAKRGY